MTHTSKAEKCAQIGPRGGWCKRNAEIVFGRVLDFCAVHEALSRSGVPLQCRKCGGLAPPIQPER